MLKNHDLLVNKAYGKIILSGEHSVVYGAPAIAINVPLFITGKIYNNPEIKVTFEGQTKNFSVQSLLTTFDELNQKYQQYLNNTLTEKILNSPWQLIEYLLGLWIKLYPDKTNFHLEIELNNFPLGCGLGGSAAFITVILKSLSRFFLKNFSTSFWFPLAKQAENLQHGKSSGLDLWVSFYEKACWTEKGIFKPINLSADKNFYLIHTGQPKSSTGECVAAVTNLIKNRIPMFSKITKKIGHALQNKIDLKPLILQNHRLLVELNIVPKKVQNFIDKIEKRGGYGKITGAGSLEGEGGGIVIVWNINALSLKQLVNHFGYKILCK